MSAKPIFELFNLSGKVALVTGANSGIGAEIADALAEAGAAIVLVARRAAQLDAARQAIEAKGGRAVTIPWGDVSTAFYSTGIPNIEVYAAFPPSTQRAMRLSRYFAPLLGSGPAQAFLKQRIRSGPPGPETQSHWRCSAKPRLSVAAAELRQCPICWALPTSS